MSSARKTYDRKLAALLAEETGGVRKSGRWHERILEGLTFAAVERLKARLALTDAELARLLGIGEATLRRARVARSPLDSTTSNRLYRLSKVVAVAEDVLEDAANAKSWLRRPQPALGGAIPLELLTTEAGADEVETLLRRIDYGVYT